MERSAEDIRDVFERFEVLYRVNEEYGIRKEQLAEANRKLTETHAKIEAEKNKGTYEKNKQKLEASLELARKDKTDALRRIKRKVRQLMHVKETYNKFKVKRFRQGFTRYNDALREASQNEIQKLTQIREFMSALSVENPEAAKVIETVIENPINQQSISLTTTETYDNNEFKKENNGGDKDEEKNHEEPLFGDDNGPLFPPEENVQEIGRASCRERV